LEVFKDTFRLGLSFEQRKSLREAGNPLQLDRRDSDSSLEIPIPDMGDLADEEAAVQKERPSSPTPSLMIGSFRIETSFLSQLDKPKRDPKPKPMRREPRWDLIFATARERNLLKDCIASEWKDMYKVDLFVSTK
jgi:hypothetical protein